MAEKPVRTGENQLVLYLDDDFSTPITPEIVAGPDGEQ
jgi:hypothetical protein